jgi:hypothetical protein
MRKMIVIMGVVAALYAWTLLDRNPPPFTPQEWKFSVLLPKERTQPLGTLFQIRDANDTIVAEAGFSRANYLFLHSNDRTLELYVNDPAPRKANDNEATRLGKPNADRTTTNIKVLDGKLLAFSQRKLCSQTKYLSDDGSWQPNAMPAMAGDCWDVNRYGGQVFTNTIPVIYQNETPLLPAHDDLIYSFLMPDHLMLAHQGGEYSICPFTAQEAPQPITDIEKQCTHFQTPQEKASPYTYGVTGADYLVTGSYGGVYRYHEGQGWDTVKTPDKNLQFYSMTSYNDTYVLGEYPHGKIWFYKKGSMEISDFPGKLPQSEKNQREAQSLLVFAGDLYVGVWPWGEVWRHNSLDDSWQLVMRAFSQPDSSEGKAPFTEQMQHLAASDRNFWGQRIMSFASLNGVLYFSTGNKNAYAGDTKPEWMTQPNYDEYGAVWKVTPTNKVIAHLPVQLSMARETPMQISIGIDAGGKVAMNANDRLVGSGTITQPGKFTAPYHVVVAQGAYGPSPAQVSIQ